MPFFPAVSGVPRIRYNLSGLSGPRRRADTALVGFSQSLAVAHAGRRGHRPPARVGVTLTGPVSASAGATRAPAPASPPRGGPVRRGPVPNARSALGRGFLVAIRRDTARVYFFTRRLLGDDYSVLTATCPSGAAATCEAARPLAQCAACGCPHCSTHPRDLGLRLSVASFTRGARREVAHGRLERVG